MAPHRDRRDGGWRSWVVEDPAVKSGGWDPLVRSILRWILRPRAACGRLHALHDIVAWHVGPQSAVERPIRAPFCERGIGFFQHHGIAAANGPGERFLGQEFGNDPIVRTRILRSNAPENGGVVKDHVHLPFAQGASGLGGCRIGDDCGLWMSALGNEIADTASFDSDPAGADEDNTRVIVEASRCRACYQTPCRERRSRPESCVRRSRLVHS